MKGVPMYHSVQVLRSRNYSIREIAQVLKLSPTTVQIYLKMDLETVQDKLLVVKRASEFSQFADYIRERLMKYPKLTASKLYRELKEKNPEISSKNRAFRNYFSKFKTEIKEELPKRNYSPVIDDLPGCQIQVDPGETTILIAGKQQKVYFVAFVLSYSRMRYFYIQTRPFKTNDFIKAHIACFNYFGGYPKECLYDQTKLVVISEHWMEVWLNKNFHEFALKTGFNPVICHAYDPESKGKVEKVVQYIKSNFLYGIEILCFDELIDKSFEWLTFANNEIHGTTKKKPTVLFAEEKTFLKSYISQDKKHLRLADKVGLISYEGNKYSVPLNYQRRTVLTELVDQHLVIFDRFSNNEICRHLIALGKGKIVKNSNHYRNYEDTISDLKDVCLKLLDNTENGNFFVEKLIKDNPKIVRDQLRGLKVTINKNNKIDWNQIINASLNLNNIKVSVIENLIKNLLLKRDSSTNKTNQKREHHQIFKSVLDRSLEKYNEVCKC